MALASEYSVGVAAPAFPRDPLNVNVYLEHVLVGQALEPLFTLGDDGLVKGGIAEKWEFSRDQKEITISLRRNLFFSNGKPLTSEDVKYSLDRHISNPASQSYNYLRVIKSLEVLNPSTIKIQLHHKYVPFLLTLSRDQLGILPKGWTFDPESNEPYIGTGPYRIIRESSKWHLVANQKYRNPTDIKIQRWKIDIIDTAKNIFPEKPSDLIVFVPKPVKDQILTQYPRMNESYVESRSFSFVQYSFWWLKEHFEAYSLDERQQIREALEDLSHTIVNSIGGSLSTGIIPSGIAGSLEDRPKLKKSSAKTKINLQIIVPQILVDLLTKEVQSNANLSKRNVSIKVDSYSLSDASKIKESSCQLALISYAGGFFDPEGYLTVLPSVLGRSTSDLFGPKAESIRKNAETEFDGKKRAEYYREFSKLAQDEVRYIPGWVPTYSDFRTAKLTKRPSAFKYSYKLIDYYEK